MPLISMFRGIKIYIYWNDHMPPHFHAKYGDCEVIIGIESLTEIEGNLPHKQLVMVLGWAAIHQDELRENWLLAKDRNETFKIEPLR